MSNVFAQEFKLLETHIETELTNGVKKCISLIDFYDALGKSLNVEDTIEPFFLPANTFCFGKSTGSAMITCYYPSERHIIKYVRGYGSNPEDINIIFPNVIITHKLNKADDKWKVIETLFFATDKKVSQLPHQFYTKPDVANHIWVLPFTNIYEGGRACYGSNSMPMVHTNNLRGLHYYYQFLHTAPFNNDLGVRSLKENMHPADWFDLLFKEDTFPYNKLIGFEE